MFKNAIFFPGDQTSRSVDENRSKENRTLWGKIMRLIFTNFCCWIPICIMTFVSYGGVDLPPIIYSITAILLIPINSAANPWLYSSFLSNYVSKLYYYVKRSFKRSSKITSTKSEKRAEINSKRNKFLGSFRIRKPHAENSLDMLPSSPSSGENTVNETLQTVATEL